jgi:hypothetical protein
MHPPRSKDLIPVGSALDDLNTIEARFKAAVEHYRRHYLNQGGTR